MSKRARQYIGLIAAVLAYYIIHEGAHLVYALAIGVFKQINFMVLGMQIDVYHIDMTDMQMGFFALLERRQPLLSDMSWCCCAVRFAR